MLKDGEKINLKILYCGYNGIWVKRCNGNYWLQVENRMFGRNCYEI